jgi:hypothetical protein
LVCFSTSAAKSGLISLNAKFIFTNESIIPLPAVTIDDKRNRKWIDHESAILVPNFVLVAEIVERGAGIIVRLASDRTFANVTGGYFSVTDARALVPVSPGNDPKAQQALWLATAERVAAFSRDEAVERDAL